MTEPQTQSIDWQRIATTDLLVAEACQRIQTMAKQAIRERGRFQLVLAGGRTPQQVYRCLATTESDWSHWHLYFGDERCLPPDDQERNSYLAQQNWLDAVPIPVENIHPIAAELGTDAAADHYAQLIKSVLPFDLVLLGMGEDGHTASLFPGHQFATDALVYPVRNAPKPPPERVSLSYQALNASRAMLILVTGASKAPAVQAWRAGQALPIAQVSSQSGATVLIDQQAWIAC